MWAKSFGFWDCPDLGVKYVYFQKETNGILETQKLHFFSSSHKSCTIFFGIRLDHYLSQYVVGTLEAALKSIWLLCQSISEVADLFSRNMVHTSLVGQCICICWPLPHESLENLQIPGGLRGALTWSRGARRCALLSGVSDSAGVFTGQIPWSFRLILVVAVWTKPRGHREKGEEIRKRWDIPKSWHVMARYFPQMGWRESS